MPDEELRCRPFLAREIALLEPAIVVCLGAIAWRAVLRVLRDRGTALPRPLPRFGHGVEVRLAATRAVLLASYHPSRQNTFTGRLTRSMLRSVFLRARRLLEQAARMRAPPARVHPPI
jgi:uracil-DNA glycosylase